MQNKCTYIYLRWNRAVSTNRSRLVCAPISLTTNFVYHFRQCWAARSRPTPPKLILIMSAAAMINDGFSHTQTHTHSPPQNHQQWKTEGKFRNFIDFLLLCLLAVLAVGIVVARCPLRAYTVHRTESSGRR